MSRFYDKRDLRRWLAQLTELDPWMYDDLDQRELREQLAVVLVMRQSFEVAAHVTTDAPTGHEILKAAVSAYRGLQHGESIEAVFAAHYRQDGDPAEMPSWPITDRLVEAASAELCWILARHYTPR